MTVLIRDSVPADLDALRDVYRRSPSLDSDDRRYTSRSASRSAGTESRISTVTLSALSAPIT